MKICESPWKPIKIVQIWKSVKYDESRQRTRSQPGIEQTFRSGQQVEPQGWCQVLSMLRNPRTSMKIYENQHKPMEVYENL